MKNRYKKDRTLKYILEHFVKIPNTDVMISICPLVAELNWENSHFMLNKFNLYMPSPAIFMPYVNMVKNNIGRLRNGLGKRLSETQSKKLGHTFREDCSVWLNAKFVKGSGYRNIDLETVMGVDPISHKLLTKKEPLKRCKVDNDTWTVQSCEYLFNKQGLPAFNFSTLLQSILQFPTDDRLGYTLPYRYDLRNEGNVATFAAWFNYGEKEFFDRLDCTVNPVEQYNEVFGCIKRNDLLSGDVEFLGSYIENRVYF